MSILNDLKSDKIIGGFFGFGKRAGSSLLDKIRHFWKTNMKRY